MIFVITTVKEAASKEEQKRGEGVLTEITFMKTPWQQIVQTILNKHTGKMVLLLCNQTKRKF